MEAVEKQSNTPLVSVVMPAYQVERFIEEAIRSVQAQTVTDWELIVIDDVSADETPSIVRRMAREDSRIRFSINERNMGTARTRNRGLELCRGQYIAFLDSDDVWHPRKLEVQMERLRKTGAALCYSSYAIVDENGKKVKADYLVPSRVDFEGLLKENVIGCSTVMLDGKLLESYRFETDFYHEDYILWLRLLKDGHTVCGCTQPLVKWRLLATSRSFNKIRSASNRWKIYRQYLKLPLIKSAGAFGAYAAASLRKYR